MFLLCQKHVEAILRSPYFTPRMCVKIICKTNKTRFFGINNSSLKLFAILICSIVSVLVFHFLISRSAFILYVIIPCLFQCLLDTFGYIDMPCTHRLFFSRFHHNFSISSFFLIVPIYEEFIFANVSGLLF